MKSIFFSVIIPTYNQGNLLKNYLPASCVPIIVDNVLVATSNVTSKFYPEIFLRTSSCAQLHLFCSYLKA